MQINHLSIIKSTRQVIDIRYTREDNACMGQSGGYQRPLVGPLSLFSKSTTPPVSLSQIP